MKKKQDNRPQVTWTIVDIPESERNFSDTMISYKHYVILFRAEGERGFEEAIAWNTQTNDWEKVEQKGTKPIPRDENTICPYDDNKAIVYGGIKRYNEKFNDVYRLTITENNGLCVEWEALTTKNESPSRYQHTAHIYGNNMYIYGGKDENDLRPPRNKIWCLSLESLKWEEYKVSGDSKNKWHSYSSILYKDSIYIFFGQGEDKSTTTTDILKLNLSDMKYETIVPNQHPLLTPRENCTAQEMNGKVYVFGGQEISRSVNGKCLDEVWIYDIENNTWEYARANGKTPASQEQYMTVACENAVFVYKERGAKKLGYELCYLEDESVNKEDSLEEKEAVKEDRTSVLEKKIKKQPVKTKKPKRK